MLAAWLVPAISAAQDVWDGIDLSGTRSLTISSDERQEPIRVRDSATLNAAGADLSVLVVKDQGHADITGATISQSVDFSGQATGALDDLILNGPLTARLSASGSANIAAHNLQVNQGALSAAGNAKLTATVFQQPMGAGGLRIESHDQSEIDVTVDLSSVRANAKGDSRLRLAGATAEALFQGESHGQLLVEASVAKLNAILKGQAELHLLGGDMTGGLSGSAETKLFLHARSVRPAEKGRLQATLLDGNQAEIGIIPQFFLGQTVLVDEAGKQTIIDPGLRFNPQNGHFYELVGDAAGFTWENAKAAAEAMTFFGRGHLATITSSEEALVIESMAGSRNYDTRLWIDGTDEAEEGVWRFTSGPEAGTVFYEGGCKQGDGGCTEQIPAFADWYRGGHDDQPSGASLENYIQWKDYSFFRPEGSQGHWHDYPKDAGASGFFVEFEPLLGDASGNGVVGLEDFAVVKQNFGSFGNFATGDFNGDWTVNLSDFGLLKANFGHFTAAVPEPTGWLLAVSGLAGLASHLLGRRDSRVKAR